MKNVIFIFLFSMILFGVHGQTQMENQWILGNWVGNDREKEKYEIVLNNNGTGKWIKGNTQNDIIFSINDNILSIYSTSGQNIIDNLIIHRINNKRFILVKGDFQISSHNLINNENIIISMERPPKPPLINNWISAGLTTAGIGLKYERMFNYYFSLGADFYFQAVGFDVTSEVGFCVTPRVYPFGKVLYIGTGLGLHSSEGYFSAISNFSSHRREIGFSFVPELGTKIDLGKKGGFFMDIGLKVPQVFGKGYWFTSVPYLGFGGAF